MNIVGVGGRDARAPNLAIGGSVNAGSAVIPPSSPLAEVGVRDGVQVNVVNPGFVRTDRLDARLDATAGEQGVSPVKPPTRW